MVSNKSYRLPSADKVGYSEMKRLTRRINEALFNDNDDALSNHIFIHHDPFSQSELDEVMTFISGHAIVTSVKHTMDAIETTTEDGRKVNITLFFGGICFNRKIMAAKKEAKKRATRESIESVDSAFGDEAFEDVTGQGLTQVVGTFAPAADGKKEEGLDALFEHVDEFDLDD
ncbi:hypothetical protein SEMRO_1449_G273720.1 [Seminavis robusta]|uniref:Uncharacterized protein n=1 Tax=Seminavis robusta TaxID=568900 RepID=A0A9N8ES66_9STRA|nr:hypothetical protein SEMRO_1449_G273720.1 [Seminavis robusta]|eukprot:Sro1449_g273720.1 n/a (173) ;mRNA; f:25811-26329